MTQYRLLRLPYIIRKGRKGNYGLCHSPFGNLVPNISHVPLNQALATCRYKLFPTNYDLSLSYSNWQNKMVIVSCHDLHHIDWKPDWRKTVTIKLIEEGLCPGHPSFWLFSILNSSSRQFSSYFSTLTSLPPPLDYEMFHIPHPT